RIDRDEAGIDRGAEADLAAAIRAEMADRARRGAIGLELALDQRKSLDRDLGRGLHRTARRTLAHPAVAIARAGRRQGDAIANGAAQAAAFQGFEHDASVARGVRDSIDVLPAYATADRSRSSNSACFQRWKAGSVRWRGRGRSMRSSRRMRP